MPITPSSNPQDLALVLGGGGARAAYQAGVLRCLARHRPGLRFPIVTGVSAGAINATFLASFEGTTVEAADALTDLWSSLTVDNVFCASLWALAKKFLSWGCRLASCGLRVGPEPRALVDTEPLRHMLRSAVGDAGGGIPGIARNIAAGTLRALAISTRYDRSQEEADRPAARRYPPPAQILGQLLNAIFLDLFDEDALRIQRLNTIAACPIPGAPNPNLHTVDTLVLRPSADLGRLAADFEPRLPRAFRFATRGLGTRETESPDALSLIMFQPDYTRRLMDLGEADAEARSEEIIAFLDG